MQEGNHQAPDEGRLYAPLTRVLRPFGRIRWRALVRRMIFLNRLAKTSLVICAIVAIGGTAVWSAAGSAPSPQQAAAAQISVPTPGAANDPNATAQALKLTSTDNSENQYKPVAPCRIVDTRQGTGANGTPFGNGTARSYYVGGTFGFAPQGGKSGGCGIPIGAVAISAVVTAVTPTHSGFFRAWPQGSTEPNAALLNYANVTTGSGVTIPIRTNSAFALTMKNYLGTTELVIDVSGYYVQPIHAVIALSGSITKGSPRVLSVTNTGVGHYNVIVDRDVTNCTISSNAYGTGTFIANAVGNGTSIAVSTYNTSGVGASANINFEFAVSC